MLTLFAVLLVASPVAGQALSAWILQDGAVYHATTGTLGSAIISDGPGYNGTGRLDGAACSYSKLQPEFDRGRVRLHSRLDDGTLMMVDLDRFRQWPGEDTSILLDGETDGDILGEASHPALPVEAAVYGVATLTVNNQFYDDPMQGLGQYNYSASMVVTQSGYREDGLVRGADDYTPGDAADLEAGDHEMHLRIRSVGDGGAPITQTFSEPPATNGVPVPMVLNQEYLHRIPIHNLRYGGSADVQVTATAAAPPGLNDLLVKVRAPDGIVHLNETLAPSLLSDATAAGTFPLNRFGEYTIEISGTVALASYEVTVTQNPDRPIDLWFWWEDVAYGVPALDEYARCLNDIGTEDSLQTTAVGRPDPPQLDRVLVVLGIVGGILIALTGITLAATAIANATHRSAYRK